MKKRDLDFSTIYMNCFDLIHLMCGFFLVFREIKTYQTNPHGPEMPEFELPNFTVMADLSGFQRGSFLTLVFGTPTRPEKDQHGHTTTILGEDHFQTPLVYCKVPFVCRLPV